MVRRTRGNTINLDRMLESQSPKSVFDEEVQKVASNSIKKSQRNMIDIHRLSKIHETCNFCQHLKSPKIGSSFNIHDLDQCIITDFNSYEEPKLTFNLVMNSPDKEKWIAAMDKEITTLQEKGCWEITIIPTRRNINLLRLFFFLLKLLLNSKDHNIRFFRFPHHVSRLQ